MNYIIGKYEFFLYLSMSASAGIIISYMFYYYKMKDIIKHEFDIKAERERKNNLIEINNLKREIESEQNKNEEANKEINNCNSYIASLTTKNNNILNELKSIKIENEKYKKKHEQIAFEVEIIQKYYKDSRISMSFD